MTKSARTWKWPSGEGWTVAIIDVASIGRATSDSAPSKFIVAFTFRAGLPSVAYLTFRLAGGQEPVVIGGGLSGDNAMTFITGGLTTTCLGETQFFPWPTY
jgi:hypothetical protein